MNYCYECSSFYSQYNCKLNQSFIKIHNKEIIDLEYFDIVCPNHLKNYDIYGEKCKITLCEKYSTFHIK